MFTYNQMLSYSNNVGSRVANYVAEEKVDLDLLARG